MLGGEQSRRWAQLKQVPKAGGCVLPVLNNGAWHGVHVLQDGNEALHNACCKGCQLLRLKLDRYLACTQTTKPVLSPHVMSHPLDVLQLVP